MAASSRWGSIPRATPRARWLCSTPSCPIAIPRIVSSNSGPNDSTRSRNRSASRSAAEDQKGLASANAEVRTGGREAHGGEGDFGIIRGHGDAEDVGDLHTVFLLRHRPVVVLERSVAPSEDERRWEIRRQILWNAARCFGREVRAVRVELEHGLANDLDVVEHLLRRFAPLNVRLLGDRHGQHRGHDRNRGDNLHGAKHAALVHGVRSRSACRLVPRKSIRLALERNTIGWVGTTLERISKVVVSSAKYVISGHVWPASASVAGS